MIHLVTILASLACLSVLVFLALYCLHVARLRRARPVPGARPLIQALVKQGPRRAAGMAIVWLAFACLLHWLMRSKPAFVDSVPVLLLRIDVAHGRYGTVALESLLRSAAADSLSPADYRAVTEQLLAHPDWWSDASVRPNAIRLPVFTIAEPDIPHGNHAARSWLNTAYNNRVMTDEQLARWMTLEPPPVIGLDQDSVAAGTDLPLYVEYGRRWQVARAVPYLIDSVAINRITINGQNVNFTLEESGDSVAARGYEAAVVRFAIRGVTIPAGSGPISVQIEYTVTVFGRAQDNFGPFIFNASVYIG